MTSLSAYSSILKYFWEPASVGVKVVLLVEGDIVGEYLHPHIESKTLGVLTHKLVTNAPTKRWAFTLSKFDEPFGVRFHF